MSNESRKVQTPEGFESWLEYAVVSFDTRSAQLPFLFDFDEEHLVTRDEIHAALWADFNELRTRANLPQIDPATRYCSAREFTENTETPAVLGLKGLIARPAKPISLDMMEEAISQEASKGRSFGLCTAEEQEWLDARAVGLEVLHPYDPAEFLASNDETIAVFLAEAKESGDADYIARALKVVERIRIANRTKPKS
jgi:antitoxin ChpS